MIDGVISGILGGMLADPLGNYLSRFRYRTVFLGVFVLTILGLIIFFVGVDIYVRFVDGKVPKGSLLDVWFVPPMVSLVIATLCVFMKACAPLLTWKEAETILLNVGYARTVGGQGDVAFEKDKIRFVARNAERVVPERIEVWNKGIRKLDVILRPRPTGRR